MEEVGAPRPAQFAVLLIQFITSPPPLVIL
jgi:hypothetical protein